MKKINLQQPRIYSEELRKSVVEQVESGELTVLEASRVYEIKSPQTVYNWIYKYSRTLKKPIRLVVEKDSIDKRLKDLEARNRELEASLGRKQFELDLYQNIVDLASKELSIDLKKNFGSKPSRKK